jgi:hypothetical protein
MLRDHLPIGRQEKTWQVRSGIWKGTTSSVDALLEKREEEARGRVRLV